MAPVRCGALLDAHVFLARTDVVVAPVCRGALLDAHVFLARADVVMARRGDRTAVDCLYAATFLSMHILCLALDVVSNIDYFRRQGLVHIVSKLDNILWCSHRASTRIADFGCMCQ